VMAPACPSRAKIPAPTIEPIPIATADQKPTAVPGLYISFYPVTLCIGSDAGSMAKKEPVEQVFML